jgi:hypothetical protein
MKEMTVFLFEQIMMFAETVGKKTQFTSPNYNYKAHVQVDNAHAHLIQGSHWALFIYIPLAASSTVTAGCQLHRSSTIHLSSSLQVNKMLLEERVDGDSEGRMFRVKSTDPRGPALQYVCQAEDAANRAR